MDAEWAQLKLALTPAHEQYVTKVSTPDWAASLETSTFLYHLCRAVRATDMIDLGSGFSSYVLRRYAREAPHDVRVTSVDADQAWLERTGEFLRDQECSTDRLIDWAAFCDATPATHDVVFHDLASGSLREEAMRLAVSLVGSGGVIVFDDAQHRGHRDRMYAEGAAAGLDLYSLRSWTLDSLGIGRWAVLGVRATNE